MTTDKETVQAISSLRNEGVRVTPQYTAFTIRPNGERPMTKVEQAHGFRMPGLGNYREGV